MDRLDPRHNPAVLKLDLYCKGARLHPSFHESKDGREIMRTRAGLGSGLELVLPGDLWTNVPVTESFAQDSPYEVHREGHQLILRRDDDPGFRVPVTASPRPGWYGRTTSAGTKMTRVGTLQGTYLGIYPAKVCEYWLEKPSKSNCKFCSVGLNLGVDDADEKSVEDVLEVVVAAREESGITYVDFNTGHYDGDTYLDILEPYIRRVKEETGLLIGVQTPPHHDLSRYDALKRLGVNRVSFCFEIWDRPRFEEVCPGKHREYGLDRYLDAIRYSAELGRASRFAEEPWVANGEIIAGLEPVASTLEAIDWITSVGAVPTVCVFRPLAGTDYRHLPPPRTEDMIEVYRHLYRRCAERGLPIGLAPNVHVSLVMLPEEGRLLVEPGRYWLAELKRAALARMVRAKLERRFAAADRRRADRVQVARTHA
jgi:hypothetical protein